MPTNYSDLFRAKIKELNLNAAQYKFNEHNRHFALEVEATPNIINKDASTTQPMDSLKEFQLEACFSPTSSKQHEAQVKVHDENTPFTASLNELVYAGEHLMKGIVLIDSCMLELESISWQKEIVHEEAKRLSKRLEELEQKSSLLNTIIYLLAIPEDLEVTLSCAIGKSSIESYSMSIDTLRNQYAELLELRTEMHPLLFESGAKEFDRLFSKIGSNIQRFITGIWNEQSSSNPKCAEQVRSRLSSLQPLYQKLFQLNQKECAIQILQRYCQQVSRYGKEQIQNLVRNFHKSSREFKIVNFSSIQHKKRLAGEDVHNPYLMENKFVQIMSILEQCFGADYEFLVDFFAGIEKMENYIHNVLLNIAWLKTIFTEHFCRHEKDPLGILLTIERCTRLPSEPFGAWFQSEILPLWMEKYLLIMDENIQHMQRFSFDVQSFLRNPQRIPKALRNVSEYLIDVFHLSNSAMLREKTIQFFLFFLSTLEASLKNQGKTGVVFLINCIDLVMQTTVKEIPDLSRLVEPKLEEYIKAFARHKQDYKPQDLFQIFTNPNIVLQLE